MEPAGYIVFPENSATLCFFQEKGLFLVLQRSHLEGEPEAACKQSIMLLIMPKIITFCKDLFASFCILHINA